MAAANYAVSSHRVQFLGLEHGSGEPPPASDPHHTQGHETSAGIRFVCVLRPSIEDWGVGVTTQWRETGKCLNHEVCNFVATFFPVMIGSHVLAKSESALQPLPLPPERLGLQRPAVVKVPCGEQ